MENVREEARWQRRVDGDVVRIQLSGGWTLDAKRPAADELVGGADASAPRKIVLEDAGITAWDSALLVLVAGLRERCTAGTSSLDISNLPGGAQKLAALAAAVPERQGARRTASSESYLTRVGRRAMAQWAAFLETLAFVGEAVAGFGRLAVGRAQFRRADFFLTMYECGAQALPIVTLISVLIGLVLAFVGSIQLKMFGAEVFIADAVAVGMALEMGALMTGIIMAGRTGASFAAQLGTMQVNEEIDALKTLGFSPVEFLVLPRIAAMVLMMPLLCIYADLMGMIGGAIVGIFMLDITPAQYLTQTQGSLKLAYFAQGLIKAAVFGVLIAFTGCQRGMQCGRSAAAVGEATTSAVVSCIVFIVVSDAMLTIIYNVTGFP